MRHVYVFYLFMTFSFGVISLGIAAIVYVKTREKLLRYYVFFYTIFTLNVVSTVLYTYIRTNIPTISPYIMKPLWYFQAIIVAYYLMFAIAVFSHELFSVPHAKIKNVIVGGIAIFACLADHFFELVIEDEMLQRVADYIEDAIFFSVVFYAFLAGIYYSRQIQDPAREKLARKIVILLGIFLPGMVNDTFLSDWSPIRIFPILYCGFSIVLTHHLLKHYLLQPQIVTKSVPDEAFFAHYNITPREQEIIPLILQGYSNKKIGETLYISLNTVKTHIRSIYAKFGVKNRYELISLVKDACLSPPSDMS